MGTLKNNEDPDERQQHAVFFSKPKNKETKITF